MSDFSFISNAHPAVIESMYRQYEQDPLSVEDSWRHFFKGFDFAMNGNGKAATLTSNTNTAAGLSEKEFSVMSLIHGYRDRGHLLSQTNPIRPRVDRHPHLQLDDYGLSEADLTTVFKSGEEIGLKNATLQQIIARLQDIYCAHIGFEYCHIEESERRKWLRERIENRDTKNYNFPLEKKRRILEKLNGATGFEEFLGLRFQGEKRFSLEGGEATVAALDAIINCGADLGVEEVMIGMAHRGRLNVLANIMGKTYENIFNEFNKALPEDLSFGSGDVKYHMGYSSQTQTPSGKNVHLKLCPNPSHLETVNPVIEGFLRAKAEMLYNSDFDRVLPIVIHGDAAAAGQGVVYETVQMSMLKGYHTGGSLHFVINNQIGFTTDFADARTSTYSTAAANMIQAPVFHVNGDDPEAVVFVCELAMEYRQLFNTDVFVDMVCYRRHGHNEADGPEVTQPEMYKIIKNHKNVRILYSEQLIAHHEIEAKMAEEMKEQFRNQLDDRLNDVKQHPFPYKYQETEEAWRKLTKKTSAADYEVSPATGINKATIDKLVAHLKTLPEGFSPQPQIRKMMEGIEKNHALNRVDWATAELMAYGSILLEGKDVRMSGQDVKRGTFSHRQCVVIDKEVYTEYNRLATIDEKQGKIRIYNSLLSEYAVLGFEYGYALASPDNLVIWEAQFGDFGNGAQIMIDQYIASAETKWLRQNGLVMLLPHGFEGQGPEHSSARMERYLQLCAEHNITVANVTTPANLFHIMRRQLARPFRKPMVIMTPKSNLRNPLVVSDLSDFETGKNFQEVLDDTNAPKKAKKVVFCSGKIYYDLIAKREELGTTDVAIVRLEQLYPYPATHVEAILKKYKGAKTVWVQEEPENNGAWQYLTSRYEHFKNAEVIARKGASSPATGYVKLHLKEQEAILIAALS
jgi:2-oxoglutarate dehydrogenase E1 component